MDKQTIFKVFFKSDINGEQKFNEFSQLTPAGRRVVYLVINSALGGKPKNTLQWKWNAPTFDKKRMFLK